MVLTNYIVKHYFDDNIDDSGWGCGWRCIQMLLSHLGIEKNIFTIATEINEMLGEDFKIDNDNKKIDMADTTTIMLYVSMTFKLLGAESTDINMYHLTNTCKLPELFEKIKTHFATTQTLIVVTAGGATALIGGIRKIDEEPFEVYLVDPHVQSKEQNFEELKQFGKGGRGWININDIVLKGKDEIGIEDDNEFLMNSSCLFGFLKL
jgi:hypothetical protein